MALILCLSFFISTLSFANIRVKAYETTPIYLFSTNKSQKLGQVTSSFKGLATKQSQDMKWVYVKAKRVSGWVLKNKLQVLVSKKDKDSFKDDFDLNDEDIFSAESGSDLGVGEDYNQEDSLDDDFPGDSESGDDPLAALPKKSLPQSLHFYVGASQWQNRFSLVNPQETLNLTQLSYGPSLGAQWKMFFNKHYLSFNFAFDYSRTDLGLSSQERQKTSTSYRAKKGTAFSLSLRPSYQFWFLKGASIGPAINVMANMSEIPLIPGYELEGSNINFRLSYGLESYVYIKEFGLGAFVGVLGAGGLSVHSALNLLFRF